MCGIYLELYVFLLLNNLLKTNKNSFFCSHYQPNSVYLLYKYGLFCHRYAPEKKELFFYFYNFCFFFGVGGKL